MFTRTRAISAPPEAVWAVISDGWLYPLWMVGATAMRDVDDEWPRVGARLHHATGVWPLVTEEITEVLGCRPCAQLDLRVSSRLLGEARICLALHDNGAGTSVTLDRELVSGPRKLVPGSARQRVLEAWGSETLTRLCLLATGRAPA